MKDIDDREKDEVEFSRIASLLDGLHVGECATLVVRFVLNKLRPDRVSSKATRGSAFSDSDRRFISNTLARRHWISMTSCVSLDRVSHF